MNRVGHIYHSEYSGWHFVVYDWNRGWWNVLIVETGKLNLYNEDDFRSLDFKRVDI